MAQTIPSELMITDVSITNYHRVYATRSLSGVQLRRDSGIQWFTGDIKLQAYGYDNVRLLNGFLANLKGQLNEFEIPLSGAYVNPHVDGNPILDGDHTRGDSNITVHYAGTDIAAGSVFTLPNDTKLYTLLEPIDLNYGYYDIVPALKIPHSTSEKLNFKTPVLTAVLDGNETTIRHEGNGKIATCSISWSELIN